MAAGSTAPPRFTLKQLHYFVNIYFNCVYNKSGTPALDLRLASAGVTA